MNAIEIPEGRHLDDVSRKRQRKEDDEDDSHDEAPLKRKRLEGEQDENALSLDDVPEELQRLVVEKTDFVSFLTLSETSRQMSEMCAKESSKIVHQVTVLIYEEKTFDVWKWREPDNEDESDSEVAVAMDNLDDNADDVYGNQEYRAPWSVVAKTPCRIVAGSLDIDDTLTNKLAKYLIKEFKKNGTRVTTLIGSTYLNCLPKYFDELLKITGITQIHLFWPVYGKYLQCPEMKKMRKIVMEGGEALELREHELLSLTAPEIRVTDDICEIDNTELNDFLKQWQSKQREVLIFGIHRRFNAIDIDRIVDGICVNEVAPDAYDLFIDLSDVRRWNMTVAKLYCLFHSDDIDQVYILLFMDDHQIVFYNKEEANFRSLRDVI